MITVQPNRIEAMDLSGGWAPDASEAEVPDNAATDVLNMLPDPTSHNPEVRKGFTRIEETVKNALEGYWVKHLHYFEVIENSRRQRMLVAILSDGEDDAANNIQVWVYDFKTDNFARVDDAGRAWTKANQEHWFAIVGGVYYGGTRSEPIYSFDPDFVSHDWAPGSSVWNDDATTGNWKTWVDDFDAGVDSDTEYARDEAFKPRTKVVFDGKGYVTSRGIRYKEWDDGQHYSIGDKVSRKANWAGSANYFKSFKCIKGHTADGSSFKPGDGSAADEAHWEKIRLGNILDDDDNITDDWFFNPTAAQTRVGAWYGNRLFLRRDDEDNHSRLQYSKPARQERNQEIPDLSWDPTDWAAVDDVDGDGGGWFDVPAMQDGDSIRGLLAYGNYLIIAKRWGSYSLSGTNEQTWSLKKLGDFGTLAPTSLCEHEGLVYMLSPSGSLVVTDGTSMEEVPGQEKIREWLKSRLDALLVGEDDFNWQPQVWSYSRFVWMSLPDDDGIDRTLVYDPRTQSFWPLDIPILAATTGANKRAQRLWFTTAVTGDTGERPAIFQYTDDPGDEAFTDDDWEALDGTDPETPITWRFRSPWYQFGVTRNERRIRRVWALIKSKDTNTTHVSVFRNFINAQDGGPESHVDRTSRADRQGEFLEGLHVPDSYAISVKVDGTVTDDMALHGIGVDTEPRRTRYHRGQGT